MQRCTVDASARTHRSRLFLRKACNNRLPPSSYVIKLRMVGGLGIKGGGRPGGRGGRIALPPVLQSAGARILPMRRESFEIAASSSRVDRALSAKCQAR